MKLRCALVFFLAAAFPSAPWAQQGPNRPEAKPLTLDVKITAVLVLDLNARCQDTKQVCSELMTPVGEFLDRTRAAGVPIIYSVSAAIKGTPLGEVAAPSTISQVKRLFIRTLSTNLSAVSFRLGSRTKEPRR